MRSLVGAGVVEHRLERALGEVGERRGRLAQAEQPLRRHHDQRARDRLERLAAEQMEELRGGGRVDDPDVVLGRRLQEALEPGAGVLRPVSLVAVRKKQDEAKRLAPLREPGDDELVEDDLRPVDEVAELGLPEHERLRRGDRIAVLEPDRGVLGQRRVVHLERRRRRLEMLHRRETLAGVRVVQDEVAMRERAALGVLTGQSDRDALDEQAGKRERLGLAPVDPAFVERDRPALRAAARASDGP